MIGDLIKMWKMVLILILTVCGDKYRELSESTLFAKSETTQIILPSDTVKDTAVNDEFQAFIERWKLTGLLPEAPYNDNRTTG